MLNSRADATMFDLMSEDNGSSGLDFDLLPLSPSAEDMELALGSPGGSSLNSDVVFGSYLVDSNSSTPYTDATQVIIISKTIVLRNMFRLVYNEGSEGSSQNNKLSRGARKTGQPASRPRWKKLNDSAADFESYTQQKTF